MEIAVKTLVAFVVLSLTVLASAEATPIMTPAGLDPGDQFRIIFVSRY